MKATLIAAAALALVAAVPASAQTPSPPSAEGAKTAESRSGETSPRRETGARREPTPGQAAARERQRKCAAEWKQAKAGGKVAEGTKWPGFWSRCNARLKGAAA